MSDGACRCWDYNNALGHEGHCCFLKDDRKGWRDDEAVCHRPLPLLPSPLLAEVQNDRERRGAL